MAGTALRLGRLFRESGRSFVTAFDHGAALRMHVAAVAKAAREADRVGLPLIVEATLWGSRHADKKDPEAVQHMCRIAFELGADAIKTEYTGTSSRCGRSSGRSGCRC